MIRRFFLVCACLWVASAAAEEKTISLIGVGDIMLGTNYPSADYLPPNGGKGLLSQVHSILQNADITFGNLEGVVLNQGGNVKNCSNPKACYAFRMPENSINLLKSAGFDLLSIANNHVGDFGASGRNNTVRVLKELGFKFAGLTSVPSTTFTKDGVRYGFVAFAPNNGTVNINDLASAKSIVRSLAQRSDIVIVSFHGGAEGSKHQHVTRKSESFYGENRGNVYQFAHAMVDAGADVVFGHGPHVTRAAELYNDRFIIYSLGNFCTYGRFNLSGPNGVAPIVKLNLASDGRFLSGQAWSIKQPGRGGVQLDPQGRAVQLLRSLTASDFPKGQLQIASNGKLTKK